MASKTVSPLVQYRRSKRLTRAAFTRKLKQPLDLSTIARIETGRQCPRNGTAVALARLAHCTPEDLYAFYRRVRQRAG